MFGKLFTKEKASDDLPKRYSFQDKLILTWSHDSEGWTAPIPDLVEGAKVYIGPEAECNNPNDTSCETIIKILNNIEDQVKLARHYITAELNRSDKYKDNNVSADNFRPTGVEIFEHEKTPEEYSLTFDPDFDPGAVYRVRFRQEVPISWGFDD